MRRSDATETSTISTAGPLLVIIGGVGPHASVFFERYATNVHHLLQDT